MGHWTDKHTVDELDVELQRCKSELQNDLTDYTFEETVYMLSLKMKVRMLEKEIEDRIVDEILLDNNTKGNYGL